MHHPLENFRGCRRTGCTPRSRATGVLVKRDQRVVVEDAKLQIGCVQKKELRIYRTEVLEIRTQRE